MHSNQNGFHGNGFHGNGFSSNGFQQSRFQNNGYENGHQNGHHKQAGSQSPPPRDGRNNPGQDNEAAFYAHRPGHGWSFAAILRDLVATWRLIWDPKVPALLKICIPFLALIYFIWPLDLMPGLPFDDLAIVLLASRMFVRLAPQDRVNRAYPGNSEQSDYYDFRNRHRRNGQPAGDDDPDVIDTTWRVMDDK